MYRVAGAVEEAIGELATEGTPVPIEVSRRLKRIVTMINKLDRFPSGDVTGLHDIAGVRAVLPTIADVREVASILEDRLILIRPRDYIAEPRDSGYRALHLVAREADLRVEIQLRTALQDTWANLVEQLGASEGVELEVALDEKEAETGLARMLAGYAFKWVSKDDPSAIDFDIDGVKRRWNTTQTDWVRSPGAAQEVGVIHTIQGYDLNYAGVIIGKDLRYDPAERKLRFDRSSYFDKKGVENNRKLGIKYSDQDILRYIVNVYVVLLTRGVRGTFVYVCDPALREYLKQFFVSSAKRAN